MIISDEAYAMLVVEPFFQGFTQREVADTSTTSEVIVGLSAESREQVDELADTAVEAGAQALGDALDDGVMYMRGFRDLDAPFGRRMAQVAGVASLVVALAFALAPALQAGLPYRG